MTMNEQKLTRKNTRQQDQQQSSPSGSGNQGFASMDQAKQREIASKGGKAAHESGHAHEFTSEEARVAGRKGGLAAHRNKANRTKKAGEHSSQQSNSASNRQPIGEQNSPSPG